MKAYKNINVNLGNLFERYDSFLSSYHKHNITPIFNRRFIERNLFALGMLKTVSAQLFSRYLSIFEPIHEILSIERTASSNPEKITKKYIDEYIARGKYKDAICDLLVKLQCDLRKLLQADRETQFAMFRMR